MQQLVQPNLSVVGKSGWCLDYARRVFGAGVVEATAWQGWENAKYKHTDGLPNVSVPVWFDYWQDGIRYGHVAVYVPGQGVYSSPWQTTYGHAVLSSVQEVERIYGVKYVGWSEDISNVRVAIGEEMIPDQDNYYWRFGQDLSMRIRGRALSREEFRKYIVGQSSLRAIEILSDDPEANAVQNWQNVGQVAVRDKWDKQIYTLQDQLKAVQTALANEKAKPPVEVIKTVEKIVEKTVYVEDIETKQNVSKILSLVQPIYDYFNGQYKSFAKYIKKGDK